MFIIFGRKGKRRLRQSIDYIFSTVSIFFRFSNIVHDSLNISWGKRRLQRRIDDMFKITSILFLAFCICLLFLEHSMGEEAPAAEYR